MSASMIASEHPIRRPAQVPGHFTTPPPGGAPAPLVVSAVERTWIATRARDLVFLGWNPERAVLEAERLVVASRKTTQIHAALDAALRARGHLAEGESVER